MNNTNHLVEEYILSKDNSQITPLLKVRRMIRKILPEFTESMKYTIPTYSYQKDFVAFNQRDNYFNLFLSNKTIIDYFILTYPRFIEGQNVLRFQKLGRKELKIIKEILQEVSKTT